MMTEMAMPTPIEATIRWPLNPNEPNTHAMIAMAMTMTRAVSVTPCRMAPALSPVRWHSSRIRLTTNTC